MSPHSPTSSASTSGSRNATAARTSSARAPCRPALGAPPGMRIVPLPTPLLLALRQVPALGDALVRQPALAVERGHAAGAGGGDGLAIDVVDGVAASEDALDVRD